MQQAGARQRSPWAAHSRYLKLRDRATFEFAVVSVAAAGRALVREAVPREGNAFKAGLRGQRLWRLPVNGGERTSEPVAYLTEQYGRLRTVEMAPDGALWVTTSNTDQATLGGADTRDGDDRILRIELA